MEAQGRVTRALYRGLFRAGKSWLELNEKAACFGPRETVRPRQSLQVDGLDFV